MNRLLLSSLLRVILLLMFTGIIAGPAANAADFPVHAATIYLDSNDYSLVHTTARLLAQDISAITGKSITVNKSGNITGPFAIIIGSPEKSSLIASLLQKGKLNLQSIDQQWEAQYRAVIDHPFPGVQQALVITGNDRRGIAYAAFDLSRHWGVSPWYWWADVPIKKQARLFVSPSAATTDFPRVKYRGIFLNDEAPALANWTKAVNGGFNHRLYERVFELLLRLKGNYIWPAMWGNAFYADDTLNRKTADDYAIVIGTSHHEPLMRAHDEWRRVGGKAWNYESNAEALREFWREGMQRATNEKIVSIGMRGDGDEPMSRETAVALLEKIVHDQRDIIANVTGQPASATPQLWALYKEVLDYYEKGMRVPDDVTLLLCDDNWGNLRRLPPPQDVQRAGGYGIYYHFDYVGDPRNYKWLNTNAIPRVWEQMKLAWDYHARQIWIVNVGDLKPMEYPISFFLDYAFNPEAIDVKALGQYPAQWAAQQFGPAHAKAIGRLLEQYSQLSTQPKPELLSADTYSLPAWNEAGRIVTAWRNLRQQARTTEKELPAAARDAYYQLILHPIEARCNLQEMYFAADRNQHYFPNHDPRTNTMADSVLWYYRRDSLITIEYHQLNGGKWNHFMDQTHIGYTYWQQPETNTPPAVYRLPDTSKKSGSGFSTNGYAYPKINLPEAVSILAEHRARCSDSILIIPGLGREGAGLTGPSNTWAEYEFQTALTGQVEVDLYFSPTLDLFGKGGLSYAVAIDGQQAQKAIFNPHPVSPAVWEKWVADNIIIHTTRHALQQAGWHRLSYSTHDPGIVLQKIVIRQQPLPASLLGPPETIHRIRFSTNHKKP